MRRLNKLQPPPGSWPDVLMWSVINLLNTQGYEHQGLGGACITRPAGEQELGASPAPLCLNRWRSGGATLIWSPRSQCVGLEQHLWQALAPWAEGVLARRGEPSRAIQAFWCLPQVLSPRLLWGQGWDLLEKDPVPSSVLMTSGFGFMPTSVWMRSASSVQKSVLKKMQSVLKTWS